MARTVHFFTPVYHDGASFLRLRGRILALLPGDYSARFHVIDDSAGTDPALQGLRLGDVRVYAMPARRGHQRALVEGLRGVTPAIGGGDIVVTLDADGEDRPEDIPALLARYLAHEPSRPIVLARRTGREESLLFRSAYFAFKRVFRVLTGTVIETGNFAVIHPSALAAILPHPSFDLAYSSSLLALGTNLHFVPCPRGRRYEGGSKMGFPRLAAHGARLLLPYRARITRRACAALLGGCAVAGLWLALAPWR